MNDRFTFLNFVRTGINYLAPLITMPSFNLNCMAIKIPPSFQNELAIFGTMINMPSSYNNELTMFILATFKTAIKMPPSF